MSIERRLLLFDIQVYETRQLRTDWLEGLFMVDGTYKNF